MLSDALNVKTTERSIIIIVNCNETMIVILNRIIQAS